MKAVFFGGDFITVTKYDDDGVEWKVGKGDIRYSSYRGDMFDKLFWIWLYWQRVPIRDPQLSANMVMGGT